ncbi:hypothetical protein CAPTEDRAFT_213747 [Capitella teleta]|uniref:Uncharacterized protein n=1 Tax=Capitella teleta TaxID=283909 RepID=R7THZ3_CAPTE|nr:hypothetical protein CAPTEDRAFT_213747 [Capitella teleta]|eukprot:ELT93443.1 hypothetical protein CAPTEDRAFT_213747 [Capitella teleta]
MLAPAAETNECLHDYIAISKVTTTQPLGKFNHRRLDLSSKRLEVGRSHSNSHRSNPNKNMEKGADEEGAEADMPIPLVYTIRFLERDASFHRPAFVLSEDEDWRR